jgi:hypothetical protein
MSNITVGSLPVKATPVRTDYTICDDAGATNTRKITFDQVRALYNQLVVTTSIFTKTTDTVLATIPGLSVNVLGGNTYRFKAGIQMSNSAIGGGKLSIGGSCSTSQIQYEVIAFNNTGNSFANCTAGSAINDAGHSVGAGVLNYAIIEGSLIVGSGGTLLVQFAQNASNTSSNVLVGSFFEVSIV